MLRAAESPHVYTELSSLQSINELGRQDSPEALRRISQQFEAIFINMMLKSMRESNSSLFDDNPLNSNEMKIHEENLHNQLSQHMAAAGGIGLADAMYRQMSVRFDIQEQSENQGRQPGPGDEAAALQFNRRIAAVQRRPAAEAAQQSPAALYEARQVTAPSYRPAALRPDAAQPAGSSSPISSPDEFVARLLPLAEEVAPRLGVDPRLLLAQSALETGWGANIPAGTDGGNSHNLFGIKADSRWEGEAASASTLEYRDGVMQRERASFRSYDSYEESFADYVDFLQSNPRYTQALQHAADASVFAGKLQQAGYATDPVYAEKIERVMHSPVMASALENAAQHAAGGFVR